MVLQCSTHDTLLQQPQNLTFTNYVAQLPFTLNGAAYSNRPDSVKGAVRFFRTRDAIQIPTRQNLDRYLADSQYYQVPQDTEHIHVPSVGSATNSTLRYEGEEYGLSFVALHRRAWDASPNQPPNQPIFTFPVQCSLVFRGAGDKIFHIVIPVEVADSSQDENQFLKAWLYKSDNTFPRGLTLNELVHFRTPSDTVSCAILQYCHYYNTSENKSNYTVCAFNQSIRLNKTKMDTWFLNNPEFSKPTPIPAPEVSGATMRPQTISEILNLMLRGMFIKKVFTRPSAELSEEQHFEPINVQSTVVPTIYQVPVKEIAGQLFKQTRPRNEAVRGLQNIKCYPIDLASQVDDQGNIFVDNQKQPVDIQTARGMVSSALADPLLAADAAGEQEKAASTMRITILTIFILFILLVALICIVVLVFRGAKVTASGVPAVAALPALAVLPSGVPEPSIFSTVPTPGLSFWVKIAMAVMAVGFITMIIILALMSEGVVEGRVDKKD